MTQLDYLAGLAANLVTTAASITATSEDANYDADNVGNGWPAKPFRFATNPTDGTVEFDFSSNKQPTLAAIIGHNIDAGITSIQIQSSTSSGFPTPTTNQTISPAYRSPTMFKRISAPANHRYWRFKLNGTNGAIPQLGELVLGIKSTLTQTQLIDWKYDEVRRQSGGDDEFNARENLTDFVEIQGLELTFMCETYAARDELRDDFLGASKNGAEPIILVPDFDDAIVVHGRVKKVTPWERIGGPNGGYHKTVVTIDEDTFGLTLA